jgi:hypothetical protein
LAIASAQINIEAVVNNAKTAEFNQVVTDVIRIQSRKALAAGTSTGQANKVFHDANAATTSYDLSGDIKDTFEAAQVFTHVKAILLQNLGDAAMTLEGNFIETVVCTGTTPKINVPAGATILLQNAEGAGWAVTNTSADTITVTNAGNKNYKILVIGVG